MTTTTTKTYTRPQSLNIAPRTTAALQELIAMNVDSAKGFHQAATAVDDGQLAELCRDLAAQRRAFAEELRTHIHWDINDPSDDGTMRGKLHRWWIQFRGVLNAGDPRAVLAEVERGEQSMRETYDSLMADMPTGVLVDVLHRHRRAVIANLERVRALSATAMPS